MPFDSHLRLTASGVIEPFPGTVIERFSMRLNLSNPPTFGAENYNQARCDDYAADWVAFWARAASNIAAGAKLREVKLARIAPTGLYTDDPFVTAVSQAGGAGGNINLPLQVALAVTLETAGRGPTRRGRMYLPCPASGVGAGDGLVPVLIRDGVLTSVQTLLNDINNVPEADLNAPKVTIASSKGYNTDVNGVTVGRVYDTIRSRRRSLKEERSAELAVA